MIKLLFPKNLTFSPSFTSPSHLAPPLLLQLSHLSSSSYNTSFLRPRDDETRNERNVGVSVWWEIDSCYLPADVNGYKVTRFITEALRSKGIKGPLQIKAFGDVLRLSHANQEALSSTGINLVHIPYGEKNPAYGSLLVDLMHWVSKNPPPAHLFLITDNRVFADMLHRLRLDNYNILLATPAKAPNVLFNAATIMWHWNSLIKGENLDGKHFNHPPDGLDGSWYGHQMVPLEDPFSNGEQLQIEEISAPIPCSDLHTAAREVQEILNSYPTGIPVSDLRADIAKAGICLDKDYYGHKKFSRFLLSVANVSIKPGPDKILFVYPIPQKCSGHLNNSSVSSVPAVSLYGEELNQVDTTKSSDEVEKVVGNSEVKSSMNQVGTSKSSDEVEKVVGNSEVKSSMNQVGTSKSSDEAKKAVGNAEVKPSMVSSHVPAKVERAVDVVHTHITESQLPPKENEIFSSSDASLSVAEKNTTLENYCTEHSNKASDKIISSDEISGELKAEDKRPGFFAWIRSWWPFRKIGRNNLTDQSSEMLNNTEEPKVSNLNQATSRSEESESSYLKQTVSHSEESEFTEQKQTISQFEKAGISEPGQTVNCFVEPELFSSSSFWSDMESFVFSGKGSTLISHSKSRKDLVLKFQKFGPQSLSSLGEYDLLQLGDMLISKKKWLEERPSLTFPFRVAEQAGKNSVGLSHGATGLRSLFLGKEARSTSQKSSEGDVDKRYLSIPHTGVSSPAIKNKHTERSRSGTFSDVQKLVSDILKEHSDGYNMGLIPRLFLDKYGYPLDVQKLGYAKLAALLHILPGVKVESTFIFPANHSAFTSDIEMSTLNTLTNNSSSYAFDSDRESSDSCPKNDHKDTQWEELGPISVTNPEQSGLETKSRQEALNLETAIHPEYEPSLSDDDSSESEGDNSYLTRSEEEGRSKHNAEDSSLLQTLESFYRSQEEDNVKSENTDTKSNGLTGGLHLSKHSTQEVLSKIQEKQQRPHKSYSFVADPESRKKDDLIDGILQNLRKSDELRMRN